MSGMDTAGQLCQSTLDCLRLGTGSISNFPGLLRKVIETRAWECRVTSGKTIRLKNLRELITGEPLAGWGEDVEKIGRVIQGDRELEAMYRQETTNQQGAHHNNIMMSDSAIQGTSRPYSITRVQRECDRKTVAAVMSGKMSPHAALVSAGLRKVRQVYFPDDPVKGLAKLRAVVGDEYLAAMFKEFRRR
jgi:hypothetical protein